jgi:class 3 adenylate cyclase
MTHPIHSVPAADAAPAAAWTDTRAKIDRRLAAVLIADVAGYSRLMERDETGTHVRLQILRTHLIEPTIRQCAGRITRSTGDGLLVTFPSATGALRCAVTIQAALAQQSARLPAAERIAFRMGLNIADILFDEHDIAGIGVNLAARLEALARPGEICVSRALKEQVQEDLDVKYFDAGTRRVKNISRPVHVYRVLAVPPSPLAALRATIESLFGTVSRWVAAGSAAAVFAAIATAVASPSAHESTAARRLSDATWDVTAASGNCAAVRHADAVERATRVHCPARPLY